MVRVRIVEYFQHLLEVQHLKNSWHVLSSELWFRIDASLPLSQADKPEHGRAMSLNGAMMVGRDSLIRKLAITSCASSLAYSLIRLFSRSIDFQRSFKRQSEYSGNSASRPYSS